MINIKDGRFWFPTPRVWHPGLKEIYGARNHKNNYTSVPATPWTISKVYDEMGWSDKEIPQEVFQTIESIRNANAAHIYKDVSENFIEHMWPESDWWVHQRRALLFAKGQLEHSPVGGGVGLWLDMGTGKTRVAIELAKQLCPEERTILVVCPKSAVRNTWSGMNGQIARWDKDCKWVLDLGGKERVKEKAERIRMFPVIDSGSRYIVVHYDIVWRPDVFEAITHCKFDVAILDEIHRIKSPSSQVSKAMAKLAPHIKYRIGLSGTPLAHSPLDAYAIYRFLDSGIFQKSYTEFRDYYSIMGGFENRQVVGWKNQEDLREKFFRIGIRIRAEDAQELPPQQHFKILVENENTRAYKQMEKTFRSELEGGEITAVNGAAKVHKLQQVTSGFMYDEGGVGRTLPNNPKMKALFELLDDIGDKPTIIWYYFRHERDMLLDAFRDAGLFTHVCDPKLSDDAIQSFINGPDRYIIAQIDAFSESIDLTKAHYAIYYSHGTKLYKFNQSIKRNHRGEQTEKCFYYHLLMRGTVDERAYKALEKQQEVVESVMTDYQEEGERQ